ncbi:hypothetical protein QFC22_003257 [Naganishia vaughanmartiniae]|uniref:Uncharacterized protein n=1 Tax=Naganishia vaughanmartiniae TaxID=1424756 RepID=A0ACC2X6Y9_9TREE|nr:hypothetical protein QFC22_003257 [Naganishia vaughanmartiniae]
MGARNSVTSLLAIVNFSCAPRTFTLYSVHTNPYFPPRQLRDLVKINQTLEKRRTNTTLPASPPSAGNPLAHSPHSSNNSAERFPRDVRAGDEEPPITGLAPRRARPLTGISEGDETFAAAQAGYLLPHNNHDSHALQRNSQHLQHPLNPFDDRASVATDDNNSFVSSSTNVIPIAFVPSHPTPVGATGTSAARGVGGAQTLQAARERAAFNGRLRVGIATAAGQQGQASLSAGLAPPVSAAPSRPARSPDLDLRLTPNTPQNGIETLLATDPYGDGQKNRASFATTRSTAPSYMSGASSVGGMMDAPVIMTSRQVHMGVRQAAEVVRMPSQQTEEEGYLTVPGAQDETEDDMRTPTGAMFRRSRPESSTASSFATFAIGDGPGAVGNPFDDPIQGHVGGSTRPDIRASSSTSVSASTAGMGEEHRLQPQRSTATFGEPQFSSPRATYASSITTDATDDGRSAHHGQGDLRFSMGSLAGSSHHQPYARDSVSTQGGNGTIGEVRKAHVGGQAQAAPTAWSTRGSSSLAFATAAASDDEDYSMPLARPRPGFAAHTPQQSQEYGGGRESMMSGRSDDSFLNAIIPPKFNHSSALGTPTMVNDSPSSGRIQRLPTSLSTETFSSPSAHFIRPGPGASPAAGQRNLTQQESPTPSPSKQGSESRHTLGLSGFEFQIGDEEDTELPPPLPIPGHRWG